MCTLVLPLTARYTNRNIIMPPVPLIPGDGFTHPINAPADIATNSTANATAATTTPAVDAATNQADLERSEIQAKHILKLEKELADFKALMANKEKEDAATGELNNNPQQDTTPVGFSCAT